MSASIYDQHLDKNSANFQPLTPLTLFERAAKVYPNRLAIIHGKQRINYREFYQRSVRLASALKQKGIGKGDTVSVMLSNTPSMLEAHFGVPMTGAVLHSMNTRLDAATIAFQLDHAESKLVITDLEFSETMKEALAQAGVTPLVIDYIDTEFDLGGERLGEIDYESFIAAGDDSYQWQMPDDEWDAISLNYTSGTTGNPKGVVYTHRGAGIACYTNHMAANLGSQPVYLWTLPMFHCNGWCFGWTITALAGVHVCLRWVRPGPMFDAIADHKVTHLCGAPIVLSTLINASEEERKPFDHRCEIFTAAAPPPEAILQAIELAGFNVTHLYGLTETYGPAVINAWQPEWDELPPADRTAKKARQGIRYPALEDLDVIDPATMQAVPRDAETIGEVMLKGNIIMKGYLKNPDASDEAFHGGWFHSGDLGVMHPDGYIQLKDRSKDIIISGGENISSIEVEDTLYKHPDILAAAVVAKEDEKWGETPCAFIELRDGADISQEQIIDYCRENLARYKCPRHVVFGDLPKTSTGKIQKFKLRERTKEVDS